MIVFVSANGEPRADFGILKYKVIEDADDNYVDIINHIIHKAIYDLNNDFDELLPDAEDSCGTHLTDFFRDNETTYYAVYFPKNNIWKKYQAYGKEILERDDTPPSYVLKEIILQGKCLLEVGF